MVVVEVVVVVVVVEVVVVVVEVGMVGMVMIRPSSLVVFSVLLLGSNATSSPFHTFKTPGG